MFLIAVTSFEYDEDSSSKTYFHFSGCDESGSKTRKKNSFFSSFGFFLARMHENPKSRITSHSSTKYGELNSLTRLHNANQNLKFNYATSRKTEESAETQTPFELINIQKSND